MAVIKSQFFYKEYAGTSSDWLQVDLENSFNSFRLVWTEGATDFRFSSSGDKQGTVDSLDKLIEFSGLSLRQIFVKGTGKIRLYAWNNSK